MDSQPVLVPAPQSMNLAGSRRIFWLAGGLWAATMVILGLGLWLERLNAGLTVSGWPLYGLTFAPFATVGALIAALRPRNAVGWSFLAGGTLNIVWSTAHHYAVYTLFVQPDALPALSVALFLARAWVSDLGFALIGLIAPLLFPDGRLPSARWRPFLLVLLGALVLSLLCTLLAPGPISTVPPLDTVVNPLGVPQLAVPLGAVQTATTLLLLLSVIGVVGSLVVRYRSATTVVHQQIKWYTFSMGLFFLFMFIGVVTRMLGHGWIEVITLPIGVTLFAAVPVAVGIAILRHRLFDIDVIIRRTVIYGVLTATLAGVYALTVGAAGVLLPTQSGLLPLLITLAIAVPLARPLHRLLQRLPLPEGQPGPVEETEPADSRTNWRLAAAKTAGVFVALAAICIFAVSIPVAFAQYQTVRAAECAQRTGACLAQPTVEEAAALSAMGLSLAGYAALVIGLRVLVAAFYIVVALIILWRKPSDPMALFVAFMLVIFGTATAPDTMPVLAAAHPFWQAPVAFMNFLGVSGIGLFLLLFPSGTFVARWTQWVAGAWVVWTALANLLPGSPFDARSGSLPAGLVFIGLLSAQLFAQVYRYRRVSDRAQREQTKWVVLGVVTSLAVLLGAIVVDLAFPALFRASSLGNEAIYRLSLLFLPLTIGIAILRHRLFDIDLIIRRTVIYGALTACLGGLYALVVGAAGLLLPSQSGLLPLLVTLAVAVPLARPLHRLLQRLPLPEGQLAPEGHDLPVEGGSVQPQLLLHKPWLLLGRTGWLLLAALALFIMFVGTPTYFNYLLGGCAPSGCDDSVQTTAAAIAQLGLPASYHAAFHTLLGLLVLTTSLVVASLLFWRRSQEPIALLGAYALLVWGTIWADSPVALQAIAPAVGLLITSVNALGFVAFTLFFLLFPDGRFVPRSSRWLLLVFVPLQLFWIFAPVYSREYIEWMPPQLILLLWGVWLLSLIGVQIYRYRRVSTSVQRQQTKWVVFGVVMGLGLFLTLISIFLVLVPSLAENGVANLIGLPALYIAVTLIPVSIGVALLRYRLFDIDVIIRRTVVYGALTASVAGLYALAVGVAGALLPGKNPLLPALITVAIAISLARPLHRLLQGLPLPEGRPAPEEVPTMIADTNAQELRGDDAGARHAALLARVVPPLGVLAGVASVAMAVGAVILATFNGRAVEDVLALNAVGGGLFALSFAAIGALVAARRPLHPLGWIYCAIALSQWFGIFAIEYAIYTLVAAPNSLPAGHTMAWLGSIAWFPGLGLALTLALALFPNGRLPSSRWRPLVWVSLILQVVWASVAAAAWPYRDRLLLQHPEQIASSWMIDRLTPILFPGLALCALASVLSLVVRFRSAGASERQQIKWLAYGTATSIAALCVGNFVPQFANGTTLGLLLVPFTASIPLATGIAILRHRLFDIDVIIRRTVVYGALVGALVALYFGSVALIQALARELTGPQSDLAIVALTLLVAALFNPLRLRVQSFIDRRFYREKVDFRVAFTAFAREVRTVIELPALLGLLVERTTALLHIAHGAVFLRDAGGTLTLAEGRALPPGADALPADTADIARLAQGEPISRLGDTTFPLLVPLLAPRPTAEHAVATELVGVLALGPRLSDQRYSRDDESLLLGLADQAGTAIYVAQLIAAQRAEAARREEQERQLAARRASPIGRAEAAAEALLADPPAAFVTLHRLAAEAGRSVDSARLLEHLPRAIGLLDHPAATRLIGLADGLSYLVASRAQPELLPAGLRALLANLQPAAGALLDGAAESLAIYELCARALDASTVAAIADLLPALPAPGTTQAGPLAALAAALAELHDAAGALRAYERVDTPQDRLAYLAAAVEKLSRVDRAAAELGAADQPLLQRVAEHWLAVAAGVMGELQTRARLACRLLTRHTWQDDLVALTITIRNDGRGAALNLQVSLTAGNEYTPLDAPARVERLATGEEVALTLRVRPRIEPGAGYFRARFLLRYDDPRGPDQVEQFADEVQLLADQSAFQFIPNPYVVGTPLQNGSPLFFGREDVLGFVQENLQAAHRNNLVLIGQRRTGKTSLLKQLPDRLGDAYLPVYLDGQSLGLDPGMPAFFLALATEIAFALDDRGLSVIPPEPEEFAASPAAAFERGFLPRVRAAIGGRHLLLLLDEFEELEAAVRRGSLDASLFGFLRHLIQHSTDLSVIFCGTHRLEELAADYWSVLFNISLYRHVGFLSRDEAERLVQEPVAPYGMRYDGLALEKIWRVTSGHPYFLQLLCHSLVNRHNKSGRSYLTVADLNDALDEILAAGEAHFVYLWAESSAHERLVLAALSRVVPLTGRATPAQVADELAGRGVGLERGAVAAALHRLALRDILAAGDSVNAGGGDAYGWKLGLLGLWVEKYRSLSRVIDEVHP